MALQRQIFPVPFARGLSQKADPKQLGMGNLLKLENGVWNKTGRIDKRNGFNALPRTTTSSETITKGESVAVYNDELLLFNGEEVFSYIEGSQKWKDKGQYTSSYITSQSVSTATEKQYDYDGVTHSSGLQCYVWQQPTNEIYYAIKDSITGQLIVSATRIAVDAISPKVVPFKGTFAIYYYNTDDTRLYVGTISVANPSVAPTFSFITGDSADTLSVNTSTPRYAVKTMQTRALGEQIYIAFNNRDGGTTVQRYSSSVTTLAGSEVLTSTPFSTGSLFYDRFNDGPVLAFYTGSGPGIQWRIWGAQVQGAYIDGSVIPAGVVSPQHVTGVSLSETELDLRIYWETFQSISYAVDGAEVKVGYSGSFFGLAQTFPYSEPSSITTDAFRPLSRCTIASEAFAYNGLAYLTIQSQDSYFVVNGNARVIGRVFPLTGGGDNYDLTTTWLPQVSDIGGGKFRVPALQKGQIGVVANLTTTGVHAFEIDFFEPEKAYQRAFGAETLHLGGGVLSMYDGVNVVEHGFLQTPSMQDFNTPGVGNTYQYRAVYAWTDNNNNLHYSAPSDALSVVLTTPIDALNQSDIAVTNLSLTEKTVENGRAPVLILLYRTKANQNVFYRLPITITNINNPDSERTLFEDTTEDADLKGEPFLYTEGNILENDPSPACSAVISHGNRIFTLDSTDSLKVYYSKPIVPGQPVEFNLAQFIQVPPSGGDVTGLASLDEKLIFFKKDRIFFSEGNGPDSTGNPFSGNFSDPTLVTTSDVGCENLRSIAAIPQGLIFQSQKGIYLLNRGLVTQYLGAPVEDFNNRRVTSSVLIPSVHQVRITLDNNKVLMYDYYQEQWGTFTNISAVDSIIWQDQHTYVRDTGYVLKETPGVFTDNGSFIPLKVATNWISMAGIQGFQRILRLMILGSYKSPHRLQVKLRRNWNDSAFQTVSITPTSPSLYGDGVYGEQSPYGGTYELYEWNIFPAIQKCTSMQIEISDQLDGNPGESLTLSNLSIMLGIKNGQNKMKDAQSYS